MSNTPDVFGPANFTNSSTARPFYGRQFGTTDTWFLDCSSSTSDDGTDLGAAWFNSITANLRSLARANGLQADGVTPVVSQDNGDDLLLRALAALVQRGSATFMVDTGIANTLLCTPKFTPAEFIAGMPFMVQAAKGPTGPATIRFGSFAPFQIRKSGNALLVGGEWADGDLIPLAFDGTYVKLLGAGAGNVPQMVNADLTLLVPEQYPTIRAALLASSSMILRSDAHLRILVDPIGYVETFDPTLGPLIGNHPYGQRISIEGPALNIGFPSGDDIDNKTSNDTLTALKGRFNATIRCTGGTNLLEIRAGTLNFSNFLMYGDGSAGSYGARVGDWQTTASSGSLGLNNVALHGFAQDNLEVTDASVCRLNNVCSTYAGAAALRVARTSNATIRTGSLVAMYSGTGLACYRGGQFAADAGASRLDFRRNLQFGIQCTAKGVAGLAQGPAIYIKDNAGFGAQGFDGDVIGPPTTVFSNNASGDLYAGENGLCDFRGASVGSTSPYRNNFGNNNGICIV